MKIIDFIYKYGVFIVFGLFILFTKNWFNSDEEYRYMAYSDDININVDWYQNRGSLDINDSIYISSTLEPIYKSKNYKGVVVTKFSKVPSYRLSDIPIPYRMIKKRNNDTIIVYTKEQDTLKFLLPLRYINFRDEIFCYVTDFNSKSAFGKSIKICDSLEIPCYIKTINIENNKSKIIRDVIRPYFVYKEKDNDTIVVITEKQDTLLFELPKPIPKTTIFTLFTNPKEYFGINRKRRENECNKN